MGLGEWVKPKLTKVKQFATAAVMSAILCTVAPSRSQAAAVDFDDDIDDTVEEVEIEYTGMRKLSVVENVAKYGILVGVFGTALVWSWSEGKREDRDEEERVKQEVERIEQWKKEFIDMEDVVADDEIMSSLNKRMGGEKEEGVDDKDGSGGVPADYDATKTKAVEEKEPDTTTAVEPEDAPAQMDAEQLERLKRMMGGGGEGSDKPPSSK